MQLRGEDGHTTAGGRYAYYRERSNTPNRASPRLLTRFRGHAEAGFTALTDALAQTRRSGLHRAY
ncbi:hypothetical protein E2R60_15055 [Paenibacillus dendritiformis]|uniref:hypothetical protein n=1 Tax=Paenibacillus dendritiformis TaxID=130049 RepID=UPI00105A7A09|nr:hypothetical protein [Paenibacillus dendritiformis]TDL54327.1 hypothetical protein E2R60_15055 [Paenibacillus dendritiformis]